MHTERTTKMHMKRHHRAILDAYDDYGGVSGSTTVPSDSTTSAVYYPMPHHHTHANVKELFRRRRLHHHDHNRHRHHHHHRHAVTVLPRGSKTCVLQRRLHRVTHPRNCPTSPISVGSNLAGLLEKYDRFMEWSMQEEERERLRRGVRRAPDPLATPPPRSVTQLPPPHAHTLPPAIPPFKHTLLLGGSVRDLAPRRSPAPPGRQNNCVLDSMMSDLVSRGVVPNLSAQQEHSIREAYGNVQQAAETSPQETRKSAPCHHPPNVDYTDKVDSSDDLELRTSKSYIVSMIDRALQREIPPSPPTTPFAPSKQHSDTATSTHNAAHSRMKLAVDDTEKQQLPPRPPRSRKSISGTTTDVFKTSLLAAGDNEYRGVQSAPPSPHPYIKTQSVAHRKDASTMTGLEAAVCSGEEDKVLIEMNVEDAIDLVSSESANTINPDFCMKISQTLTDTLLERPPPPRRSTLPPTSCNAKQSASPRIVLDRNRCPLTSTSTTNVLRIPSGQEPVYMRQLKELRWDHIRHIQREVLRLEQLERFLDTCDGSIGRPINTSFSSPV